MSLCYANVESRPDLFAALLLRAVVPALAELYQEVPSSRARLESKTFRLRLQAAGGEQAMLCFERGRCRYFAEKAKRADIVMHFPERSIEPHLKGNRFALPLPVRGFWRWRQIAAFAGLSRLLEHYLNDHQPEAKSVCQDVRSWLTLGVCLRAAVELSRNEEFSKTFSRDLPEGCAEFGIEETGRSRWIQVREGELSAGDGAPPQAPRVRILFPDSKTALDALHDRLDLAAAAGAGRIRVEGYLPLADALGVIFDRIPAYLTPRADRPRSVDNTI